MADSDDGSAATNFPDTKRHEHWPRPEVRLPNDLSKADAANILNACERVLTTGDVILCYPRFRFTIIGLFECIVAFFIRFQALHVFGDFHRKWVHSALYTGNGTVIEKKPAQHWKTYSIESFLRTRVVLIRRPSFEMNADEREKLLSKAISLARVKYGTKRIQDIIWRTIAGLWRNLCNDVRALFRLTKKVRQTSPVEQRVGIICNEYVDFCYSDAKNRTLLPKGCASHIDNMFVPAAHSWTPDMRDLDIFNE